MQLLKVIAIDSPRTIMGSMLIPINELCLKTVSRPPVVVVAEVAYSNKRI